MATKKQQQQHAVKWTRTLEDGYVLLRARISNQIELQLCQDMTADEEIMSASWTGYVWPHESTSRGWVPADAPILQIPLFGAEDTVRRALEIQAQAFFEAMAAAVASLSGVK